MSGPKVVRVVTREELVEQSLGHLARVDAAIAEWVRVLERNELMTEQVRQQWDAHRASLAGQAQAAQLGQVQAGAAALIAELQRDMTHKLEAKISAEAAARRARRNLVAAASALLATLRQRSVSIPDDLRHTLEAAAVGVETSTKTIEAAVAHSFLLLADSGSSEAASARQRELAAQLGGGEGRQTLSDWLSQHGLDREENSDPRLGVAERQLVQVEALAGPAAVASFTGRLDAARWEADKARQSLLLDALCLDLAASVQRQRQTSEVRLAIAELRATSPAHGQSPVGALLDRAEALLANEDLSAAHSVIEQAREEQQRLSGAQAAASRREAVLRGLQQLGYEVREGMETAWSRDGRLVVRDPSHRGFGVELGGKADNGKLQVRAVAIGDVGAPAVDGATETRWCGDLAQLQNLLAASGADLAIERATPAGVQPLKQVPDTWREDDEREEPRQRTL